MKIRSSRINVTATLSNAAARASPALALVTIPIPKDRVLYVREEPASPAQPLRQDPRLGSRSNGTTIQAQANGVAVMELVARGFPTDVGAGVELLMR